MVRRKQSENSVPKKKKRRFPLRAGALMTLVAVIVNVMFVIELFYVTQFSALSSNIFKLINYAGLGLLLLIDLLTILALRTRRKVLIVISIIFLVIGTALGGAAGFALSKVEQTVDKMTSTEYTVSVSTSLVIYDNTSGDPIMETSDLSGRRVGVATGTDTESLGKEKLSEAGVTPEYVEYTDYFSLFRGLISEEVDCAVLPGSYVSLINSDEQLMTYVEDTSALETFSKNVTSSGAVASGKDLTTEPFTVLVTGENEGLADTIIVVSVNPVSMDVTMTSIARDSYVPITCYGGAKSKINASHMVSESCIVDTVTQLTGIQIDYTVEFNFASVIEVVDAVGGVDVYNDTPFYGQSWNVETDELEVIPIPYSEDGSLVHMNGQEALGFVRERHAFSDGDFARQRHQQAVISDLIAKVMASRDPNTYLKILEAAGNNIKTNISAEQMVQFISYAMRKAERYYNPSNLAGVFNISSSRITGYDSSVWDDGLSMYLYTYELYDGAIQDAWEIVDNNTNMSKAPVTPANVSWSAGTAYSKPAEIQDYYNEYTDSVVGGPDDPDSSYTSPDTTYTEPVQDTTPVQEPVSDPVVPPVNDTTGTDSGDSGTVSDPGVGDSGTTPVDPSVDGGTVPSSPDAIQ